MAMQALWLILVLALAVPAVVLILVYTVRTGISPMPALGRARREVLAAVPADLEGTVYELGSGWGTLAVPLARRHPACRVVGFELSPLPWLVSRALAAVAGTRNLELRRADFMKAQVGNATAVVCYLWPGAMERLRPKLEAELGPGTLVVSSTFAVPGWTPERSVDAGGIPPARVHVYRRPPAL